MMLLLSLYYVRSQMSTARYIGNLFVSIYSHMSYVDIFEDSKASRFPKETISAKQKAMSDS